MKIAIPKERRPGEARVAASPDTVKKLIDLGFEVAIEKGAGEGSSITDAAFKEAGAAIAGTAKAALDGADFALFPIPGMAADGSLFATETIHPDRDLLAVLKPGAQIILGTADDGAHGAIEFHDNHG